MSNLTIYIFPGAQPDEVSDDHEDVFKHDERWRQAWLPVILHHQEVHPVLPDLDRVHLDFIKHVTGKNMMSRFMPQCWYFPAHFSVPSNYCIDL